MGFPHRKHKGREGVPFGWLNTQSRKGNSAEWVAQKTQLAIYIPLKLCSQKASRPETASKPSRQRRSMSRNHKDYKGAGDLSACMFRLLVHVKLVGIKG